MEGEAGDTVTVAGREAGSLDEGGDKGCAEERADFRSLSGGGGSWLRHVRGRGLSHGSCPLQSGDLSPWFSVFPQHSLSIFRKVPILTKIDLNKPSPESHCSDSL